MNDFFAKWKRFFSRNNNQKEDFLIRDKDGNILYRRLGNLEFVNGGWRRVRDENGNPIHSYVNEDKEVVEFKEKLREKMKQMEAMGEYFYFTKGEIEEGMNR